MKQVFSNPGCMIMNATKSMIGHALGWPEGLEAVVTIKAIQEQIVDPMLNLENPEPIWA